MSGKSSKTDHTEKQAVDEMHVDVKQSKNKRPRTGGRRSKIQPEKKGRGKRQSLGNLIDDEVEEEKEEEDDEEEELGIPGVVDDLPGEIKLNGENVDYEPYVRRHYEEEEDELEDIFNELKTISTSTSAPSAETVITKTTVTAKPAQKGKGGCEHKNFDFDDDVGYYCGDCGSVGIEMPTIESHLQKNCAHKNYEFLDETGIICPDCGKFWRERESCHVANSMPNGKQTAQKVQDKGDRIPQVNLDLQGKKSSTADVCGADLQLHPIFEEKMHPHQKKGFKFLSENLLGGQQRSNEPMGCVLAHAPGTGKTCLVISFIQSFLTNFPEGRPLILAPKIMVQSWENEFENWEVQGFPIYRIDAAARETSPNNDGGVEEDEDEEDVWLAPHVKTPLKEARARKLREWQKGRGVLLMSYKLFANLVTNGMGEHVLPESLDFQMSKVLLGSTNLVILDEGHLARNGSTQITRALLAMETKRRVLLSGTLFQNNFKELYTVLKLCRDDFMMSHPQYSHRILEIAANTHGSKYSNGVSYSEKETKRELMQIEEKLFTEEIGERLENYVRSGETRTYEIESVVRKLQSLSASFVDWYPGEILKNLPGLVEYSIHLNLTKDQLSTIRCLPNADQVKHHMSRQYMLLAACIHPSLVHFGEAASPPLSQLNPSSIKIEACKGVKITFILRLMASCKLAGEKLLVFCSTLDPLTYIEGVFAKIWEWRQGQQMLRLDGSMQDSDRQKIIRKFNDKDHPSQVLLASTRACKEGITLVGASRVVILDNPDNPSVVRQAVSRAFRIGQKKKVFVYRLVTTHRSEELIFKRSVNKERLSQVLLDPVSMSSFRNFLREQSVSDIEDELLQKLIVTDRENGKNINLVHRYNAAG